MADLDNFLNLYLNGLISDEEILLIFEIHLERANQRAAPRRLRELYGHFNLHNLSHDDIYQLFRFNAEHLPLLKTSLRIPDEVFIDGYRESGLNALCILLRRLSYPNRLKYLERFFGISKSGISAICRWMTSYINERFGYLLQDLGHLRWLNGERLAAYSEAVTMKGAPLNNVWGFIDGTARKMCRPSTDQNLYYSGHKRFHCLKYQSILTPDGMIVNLQGPYQGRRHDAGIWVACGVQQQIRRLCVTPERTFVLYGDPAYPVSDIMIAPYPSTNQDPHAVAFNRAMSSVRQAVEWGFGKIIQQFAFVDFSKNQKLHLQDLGGMYGTAVLLSNCHTCLYGSQASQYFGIEPPSL